MQESVMSEYLPVNIRSAHSDEITGEEIICHMTNQLE